MTEADGPAVLEKQAAQIKSHIDRLLPTDREARWADVSFQIPQSMLKGWEGRPLAELVSIEDTEKNYHVQVQSEKIDGRIRGRTIIISSFGRGLADSLKVGEEIQSWDYMLLFSEGKKDRLYSHTDRNKKTAGGYTSTLISSDNRMPPTSEDLAFFAKCLPQPNL